jgi:hypothetical protein
MDNKNQSHFGPEDLVFNKQDGKIMSGGFLVNNIFLNRNESALKTNNAVADKTQVGGTASSIFKDLAVPAGLLFLQQKQPNHYRNASALGETGVVEDSLYDKLLKLSEPDNNKRKRQTKKGKLFKNNKTKRNKK